MLVAQTTLVSLRRQIQVPLNQLAGKKNTLQTTFFIGPVVSQRLSRHVTHVRIQKNVANVLVTVHNEDWLSSGERTAVFLNVSLKIWDTP